MLTSMSRVKNWCFTLNNYSDAEYHAIFPPVEDGSQRLSTLLDYACVGKEISPTGTSHLQGFVCLRIRGRLSTVRSLLPRAHWEVARTVEAAIDYCKKDGNFQELGSKPTEIGRGDATIWMLSKQPCSPEFDAARSYVRTLATSVLNIPNLSKVTFATNSNLPQFSFIPCDLGNKEWWTSRMEKLILERFTLSLTKKAIRASLGWPLTSKRTPPVESK